MPRRGPHPRRCAARRWRQAGDVGRESSATRRQFNGIITPRSRNPRHTRGNGIALFRAPTGRRAHRGCSIVPFRQVAHRPAVVAARLMARLPCGGRPGRRGAAAAPGARPIAAQPADPDLLPDGDPRHVPGRAGERVACGRAGLAGRLVLLPDPGLLPGNDAARPCRRADRVRPDRCRQRRHRRCAADGAGAAADAERRGTRAMRRSCAAWPMPCTMPRSPSQSSMLGPTPSSSPIPPLLPCAARRCRSSEARISWMPTARPNGRA